MRILCSLFILITCGSAYGGERQIVVPVHGSPFISVSIMGTPVEGFSITKDGLVTWTTWVEDEPSENPQKYQYSSDEYEQTLNLVTNVFENNYKPESAEYLSEPRVIFQIRVGEYFRSLALSLEYHDGEPIPRELRALIEHINGLRQSNKRMQSDRQPAAPSVGG